MVAIRVEGLGKRFGAHRAVSKLSFAIDEGEVFGLLGPNGAGKTTTLRMLAGLYLPDEGEGQVAGFDLRRNGEEIRRRVGLLTEQPGLYDRLTAYENLEFFARLYGVATAEIPRRLETWLRPLGLWERRHDRAGSLSKGMRQKLAIARAVIHDPAIVLLDEPTSGLDPESARTVRDAIGELARQGRTLLLCSHNLFEVERLCRRVAVLLARPGEGGQLVALTEVAHLRGAVGGVRIELGGEAEAYAPLLRSLAGVVRVSGVGSRLEIDFAPAAQPTPLIVAELVRAGALVCAVVPSERALEEAYLDLVGELAEAGAA